MTSSTTGPHHDAPGRAGAVADHATDGHGDEHGHGDHAHDDGERLGPIDLTAWGAGLLGVVLGLVVAFCFVLATSAVGG